MSDHGIAVPRLKTRSFSSSPGHTPGLCDSGRVGLRERAPNRPRTMSSQARENQNLMGHTKDARVDSYIDALPHWQQAQRVR